MGCSGSRPEADDDTPPQALTPFRRRFDEIRHRRNGRTIIKDDRLSCKQLLHDEVEDDHDSPCPTEAPYLETRMSFSLPSDSEGVESGKGHSSKPKMETTTEVPLLHHRSSTHENDHNDNNNKTMESDKPDASGNSPAKEKGREMEKDDKDGEGKEHERKREEDERSACGGVDDEEGDGHGEGEGGFLAEDNRMIAPGSPSFRDYFLTSAANAANSDSSDAGDEEDGSAGEKSELTPSETKESSLGSSEVIVVKSMKKENKGRRFRNVLPKGTQGGVKKMWNVRSCYHPSRSSNHGKVDAS